jgi:hypothetical protein
MAERRWNMLSYGTTCEGGSWIMNASYACRQRRASRQRPLTPLSHVLPTYCNRNFANPLKEHWSRPYEYARVVLYPIWKLWNQLAQICFPSWGKTSKSTWYCGHCLAYCTSLRWQMRVEQSVECEFGRGNRSTRRKRAPVPLCPPHDLTRARTRVAAVGSRRLTAWAMARPLAQTYCTRVWITRSPLPENPDQIY